MSEIKLRRAYEEKGDDDGYRILVDRLWPRGIKKEDLSYSWWAKEITPSDKLRKSFHKDAENFEEFKKSYMEELNENKNKDDYLDRVEIQLEKHNVTLVYGAKDEEHNNAVVLKEWTEKKLKL